MGPVRSRAPGQPRARLLAPSKLGGLLGGSSGLERVCFCVECGRAYGGVRQSLADQLIELPAPASISTSAGSSRTSSPTHCGPNLHDAGAQATGRKLEGRHAAVRRNAHEEVFCSRIERIGFEAQPRSHHPDHLAGNDPLGSRGVADLFADGDLFAMPKQCREVARRRVVRHAGHRNLVALRVRPARGQGDVEDRRRATRIVEEHLVEITETKEDDRVGMLPFGPQELTHDRGVFRFRVDPRTPMNRVYSKVWTMLSGENTMRRTPAWKSTKKS